MYDGKYKSSEDYLMDLPTEKLLGLINEKVA